MSRDWNDPNATWQDPNNPGWDDSDEAEMPPLSYVQDDIAATSNPSSTFLQDEPEMDELPEADELMEPQSEPLFTRFELLRQFGQQISPVLVPLLFGGLTFLFILPVALGNHFYLRSDQLWPIALVLIALAVLQGMLLYYAGSNNIYWTLAVIGGFILFLLVGCFALFGPIVTAILFAVLVIAGIVVIRLYMYPVPEGYVDIVYSFGKYSRTFFPGLNFLMPWEWIDSHLYTRERQWTCPEQVVQVSRDEDVHLKATISYQLMPEDAYIAITRVENWEKSLQEMLVACLQSVCHELTPNDFIAWPQRSRSGLAPNMILNNPVAEEEAHWEHINSLLYQKVRDPVSLWGVIINWVQIRDVTLTPRPAITHDTGQVTSAGAATASNQSSQTQVPPKRTATDTSGRVATPAQPDAPTVTINPGTATAAAAKFPKEEVLKNAYEQIKNGKVTSPEAIRKIADSFQAIADNLEASKSVSFDAERAAQTLYERAKFFEEQAAMMAANYTEDDTPTQVDWPYRGSKDDNYTAGG